MPLETETFSLVADPFGYSPKDDAPDVKQSPVTVLMGEAEVEELALEEEHEAVAMEVPAARDGKGKAQAHIQRIKVAENYYSVLGLSQGCKVAAARKKYYALARILHPDKCGLAGAQSAMAEVSLAYETIANPVKRSLYDEYMSDSASDPDFANSYAEWEVKNQQVSLPQWMMFLLLPKNYGWVTTLTFVLCALLISPVLILSSGVAWVVFSPYLVFLKMCRPENFEALLRRAEEERSKWDEKIKSSYETDST